MSVLCFSCIHWSISSLCVVPYRTLHVLRADWLKPTLEIIVFLTSKFSNIKMVILIHFLNSCDVHYMYYEAKMTPAFPIISGY